MSTIKPIQDRIVIKELSAEKKTDSGIILTGNVKSNQGVVLAVGPGIYDDRGIFRTPTVNVDDKVVYVQEAGTAVKVDNEEYRILQEKDILGVIK